VLGIRRFVGLLEEGLDDALAEARKTGAALIAAHPYTLVASAGAPRATARFAKEPEWAAQAVDRFEVCNRHDFFEWVARARLPVVASGDTTTPSTWRRGRRSCRPRRRRRPSSRLRSSRPVSLTAVEPARIRVRRAA
jgi:hypothetical protein